MHELALATLRGETEVQAQAATKSHELALAAQLETLNEQAQVTHVKKIQCAHKAIHTHTHI